jgi:predicted TIM-barrel fold metal-dependent hydrolase
MALIIDSHAHLKHGDRQKTEYTPEEIVRVMDGAGIAKSVVFAMSTTTERSIHMAREAVARFPDRLVPYVYALPRYDRPVIQELEQAIAQFGFKGIKMHMGECKVEGYIADSVFALAARYDVPCLIDFAGRLDVCEAVVTGFPQTKIVICHFGRYLSTDEAETDAFIRVAEEHDNALLDASGVVLLHKIEEAAGRIGAERILFGTDGPHRRADGPAYTAADTVQYARQAVEAIGSLRLSRGDKDAILGGNCARLLRL